MAIQQTEARELIVENLKRYREESGLSQREVAEYLGMTTGAYQHYEGDRAIPCVIILFKLTELYGLPSVNSFFEHSTGKTHEAFQSVRDVVYRAYCLTRGKVRKGIDALLGLKC